jgi:hypothetical protein
MRRLTIFLALSSFAAIGGAASAAASPHAPSRPYTYRTVIHLSGRASVERLLKRYGLSFLYWHIML